MLIGIEERFRMPGFDADPGNPASAKPLNIHCDMLPGVGSPCTNGKSGLGKPDPDWDRTKRLPVYTLWGRLLGD